MQFPVLIGLRRSLLLPMAGFLLFLPVLPLAFLAPHPLPWRIAYLLCCLLLLLTAARSWLRQPPCLALLADGSIRLADEESGRRVLGGTCIHPWLTVFRLENGQKRPLTVVVTVDSLNREDFRRLRVFLRWRLPLNAAGGA